MNAADRALIRDLVARARLAAIEDEPKPRRRYPRCVYCGRKNQSTSGSVACDLHRDLPQLDPKYATEEAAA